MLLTLTFYYFLDWGIVLQFHFPNKFATLGTAVNSKSRTVAFFIRLEGKHAFSYLRESITGGIRNKVKKLIKQEDME